MALGAELRMKALIFLVHESLEKHNHWHDPAREPWQRMLTWAQIREMSESGLVDFANHTMNHAHLTHVPLESLKSSVRRPSNRRPLAGSPGSTSRIGSPMQ